MFRLHVPTGSVLHAALAAVLWAPCPAAAQPRIPTSTAWEALPFVMAEGTAVVVTARDGRSTKGRVRSLSDTAFVLEGGKVRTIPAAAVASIEGRHGPRRVWDGAEAGFSIGAFVVGWSSLLTRMSLRKRSRLPR